jgi:hypothetical protein
MISATTLHHPSSAFSLYHTQKTCNASAEFLFRETEAIQKAKLATSIQNTNLLNGEPFGLHVLHSQGFMRIPSPKTKGMLCIPNRAYERAVSLLQDFSNNISLRRPGQPAAIAWITRDSSPLIPSTTALASRGFEIEHMVFIESHLPLRALRCACEENFFDAILFDEPATQASMHIARRWLKPPHQPPIAKGSELNLSNKEKLIIFLD